MPGRSHWLSHRRECVGERIETGVANTFRKVDRGLVVPQQIPVLLPLRPTSIALFQNEALILLVSLQQWVPFYLPVHGPAESIYQVFHDFNGWGSQSRRVDVLCSVKKVYKLPATRWESKWFTMFWLRLSIVTFAQNGWLRNRKTTRSLNMAYYCENLYWSVVDFCACVDRA